MEENTAPIEESGIGEGEVTATDQEPAGEIQQTEQPEVVQEPAKTFTQEELDKIVEKRLAKERRKLERQQQPQQQRAEPVKLDPAQFESQEAYLEAVAEQKAQQKIVTHLTRLEQEKVEKSFMEAVNKFKEDHPDYDEVAVYRVPINDFQAALIKRNPMGPAIGYYLGENEEEFYRIDALPPAMQAVEIGAIGAMLKHQKSAPQVSNAPAPIKPIGAKGQATKNWNELDQADWDRRSREKRWKR